MSSGHKTHGIIDSSDGRYKTGLMGLSGFVGNDSMFMTGCFLAPFQYDRYPKAHEHEVPPKINHSFLLTGV